MEHKTSSISSHRKSVAYRPQVASNNFLQNDASPKKITLHKLMEMLGVENVDLNGIGASPDQTIKVKYTNSGKPVLKFGANSELPTKVMEALRMAGNPGAGCKLAAMIDPKARTDPLFCLLEENLDAATITPGQWDHLKSALIGSCKYCIKVSGDVDAFLMACPSDLKADVFAGVLALLPFGLAEIANLLRNAMTGKERSAAYAKVIGTARNQTNGYLQIEALTKLQKHLGTTFPRNSELAKDLSEAIAEFYKPEPLPKKPDGGLRSTYLRKTHRPGVTVDQSSAASWREAIAGITAIASAIATDEPLSEQRKKLEQSERVIAAALKDGLTLEQLEQLAGTVLYLTNKWDQTEMAGRLGARLLEAVFYMEPMPVKEIHRIVGIVTCVDEELKLCVELFYRERRNIVRMNFLEGAQLRAQELNLPLDFVSAIPKWFPTMEDFKPAKERLEAYRTDLANPGVNGRTLESTVINMGWEASSSSALLAFEFGDFLSDKKYEDAEKALKGAIDPMFIEAATERLQQLKAAKQHAMKLPRRTN